MKGKFHGHGKLLKGEAALSRPLKRCNYESETYDGGFVNGLREGKGT